MSEDRESLKPVKGADRSMRQRLTLKDEFLLALLPTLTVLAMLLMVETLSRQRLLFASLAQSAFLIYLDPQHGTNTMRTLVFSHTSAAIISFLMFSMFGAGYASAGAAMVATITLMLLLDIVHPPAISTLLGFAFRAGEESNLVIFGLAVLIIAILVVLEKIALWIIGRFNRQTDV